MNFEDQWNIKTMRRHCHNYLQRKGGQEVETQDDNGMFEYTALLLQKAAEADDCKVKLGCCKHYVNFISDQKSPRKRRAGDDRMPLEDEARNAEYQELKSENAKLRKELGSAHATIKKLQLQVHQGVSEKDVVQYFRSKVRASNGFRKGFQQQCCNVMTICHTSFIDLSKLLFLIPSIFIGGSLPDDLRPAESTIRNWMVRQHHQVVRSVQAVVSDRVLHLAGDGSPINGYNFHVLLASCCQDSTPRTYQLGMQALQSHTGENLAQSDANTLVKYRVAPGSICSYTTDHAHSMLGQQAGAVAMLSQILGTTILPVGCALHANALELKYFCKNLLTKCDASGEMTVIELMFSIRHLFSMRKHWYRTFVAQVGNRQFTLIPEPSLHRWPTVCAAASWMIRNLAQLGAYAHLWANCDNLMDAQRKQWQNILLSLHSQSFMVELCLLADFGNWWITKHYQWFLGKQSHPLFRAAECSRRALEMTISLDRISANDAVELTRAMTLSKCFYEEIGMTQETHQNNISRYCRAVQAMRVIFEKHYQRTWLRTPLIITAIVDPKIGYLVVQAFKLVQVRLKIDQWKALINVPAPQVSDWLDQNLPTAFDDISVGIESPEQSLPLLRDVADIDGDTVLWAFVKYIARQQDSIKKAVNRMCSVLRDPQFTGDLTLISLGRGVDSLPDASPLKLWKQQCVDPISHTNMGIEGKFSKLSHILHYNMTDTMQESLAVRQGASSASRIRSTKDYDELLKIHSAVAPPDEPFPTSSEEVTQEELDSRRQLGGE